MKQGGSSAAVLSLSPETPELAFNSTASHEVETESSLNRARDQLIALRRQQEELERQKGELEELRRKQDEYARGKSEMIEKITRSLVTLEREQIESQRVAELSGKTRTALAEYLDQLKAIQDQDWNSENVRPELSRALGIIENARMEYNRACSRLDCMNPNQGPTSSAVPATKTTETSVQWDEMLRYLCLGAAASAPLILAGTIWLLVLITMR